MSQQPIIAESELILNPDGSVYHLKLLPEDLADIVIKVGDPDRVAKVSGFFDSIELKKQKREFVTHTGSFNGKRITVISTGIGTDNIDIVLNELDALVNVDFKTRQVKPEIKALTVVRIGTSGSLQADIPLDSMVVSEYGLGFDNLMHFYNLQFNHMESAITEAAAQHFAPLPIYTAQASEHLFNRFKQHAYHGITATCSGFYGPQGRKIRGALKIDNLLDKMQDFHYDDLRITNFEMETSGIYGLGRLLGHHCLSVNTIVANRALQTFSKDPYKAVDEVILKTLEILTK